MSIKHEENDVYVIPPNFIETGTIFGGTIKFRNAAEAVILSLLIGFPVFHLPVTLTTKIIIACLTVLPAALFAIIGIGGESLSSFVVNFFVYLKNRRVIGLQEDADAPVSSSPKKEKKKANQKPGKKVKPKKEDFAEEFGQRKEKKASRQTSEKSDKKGRMEKKIPGISPSKDDSEANLINPAAAYLPIKKIENGIIYTKDHRYVKIVEVIPINFLLRSAREQRSIIYSFVSYLKISPVKLQFKVLTKRADINRHLETIQEEMKYETDERCIALQKDYETLIRRIGSKEAITRRFFVIFEYEPFTNSRGNEEADAISFLTTAVRTAKTYLQQCGNELMIPDNEDEMATEVFYNILNRRTSAIKPLSVRVNEVIGQYINAGRRDEIGNIPAVEFMAPESIDYTHGNYVVMDGVYHSYLLVPCDGYRTQVCAGWISLLVNAGEGIDVDVFFHRQPKDRIQQKLGQQLRINRSKIKDTSDTNSDFDDLDSAIRSGYFLKEGWLPMRIFIT